MKKILLALFLSGLSLFAFEHLTPENMEEKLKGKNAIVDFYADWCPPCKVLAKNLEGFDKLKPMELTIYKIDIVKYMQLANKYKVNSLPTIAFFKDGKLIKKEIGIKDIPELTISSKKYFQ